MIVYAEREQRVHAASLLREVQAMPEGEERLIRFGQWESAVLDAHCPEVDDDVDPLAAPAPEYIAIRPQEGFAYYALYPAQYQAAAKRFARERRPHACVVVGIRSIGTTLSRVVADALDCAVWRFTVRPRGHPFDRRLRLSQTLSDEIRQQASRWFLVVDEGPGLSGSSFTSVAEALNELGVPDERIVLLPSHEADPESFVSERARARWPRHRKYVEAFDAARHVPQGARDISGGQWREITGCDAAVQPSHERRKYLAAGVLWKFAGLGHYGRAKHRRAAELAETGFTPDVLGFDDGFLRTRWVAAECGRVDESLVDTAVRYLAHVAATYPTGQAVAYEPLAQMIEVNTRIAAPGRSRAIEEQGTVAIDGRMLPHEWIRASDGEWVKTDAVDHHDDHFFPGCQDIAWDLAGTAVEFEVAPEIIVERYARLRREAHLSERVDFYTVAYLAYRIGYCSMAADALGTSIDGRRFAALRDRYTAALVCRPATSRA